MLSCGLLLFFFRNQLIQLFTADADVLRTGAVLLVFAAVYQLADAMYVSYSGALRGAGDTFVPAVATGVLNWSLSVVLGFVVARYFPRWGAVGPWTLATAYGLILSTFIYIRFRRGGWKRIDLERFSRADRVPTGFPVNLAAES